jgi:integrase
MPPPTADRIAPGIYRDHARQYATVHVRGAGFREARFALAETLETIQAWRQRTRAQLLDFAERGAVSGTFAHDARRYLNAFTKHLASAKDRKLEIGCWVKVFGHRPRGTIKPADVARVRSQWLQEDYSPKTINNRTDSLRHLYRSLDGRKAWTPCDDLQRLHVHKQPMQFVTNETILTVDKRLQELEASAYHHKDSLHSAKVRARFRVLVSTGRRPSELMRAEPGDVDLARRIWIPRDGKGGFSPGIYLNDDMRAAWELFIEAEAWGTYKTAYQAAALRRAGWPADVKPYQARHTLGITLSEGGADLSDVGSMMGHKQIATTRRHYVPVLNSRMQKASESLAGRFSGWPEVQTGLQTSAVKSDKVGPKTRKAKPAKPTRKPGQK